ncbi:pseudouridine synthase [Coralliovum pocilloporae]|uniref:pseudouridine synthase n=1 Tax=Coralliovum pocilloporae TaxID=3066369 RepID=UPI003307BFA2
MGEAAAGERIAKVLARAGLCSRRDAERWIEAGRVSVNGRKLSSPALNVTPTDTILVDGEPLPQHQRTRLWLYHKPRGLVTTTRDPEGRPTVFDELPEDLPRVITVGRLDINTEGLLLLTNDGGLARVLELPETGWLRRYRVRAHGKVTEAQLKSLADGIIVEGVMYGAIEAEIDREQGDNLWLTLGLREGKNREVKKVLGALGLTVNRLIRVSYGPFQLMDLKAGAAVEIRSRVLRDQLGERLARESGADFEAPLPPAPKAQSAKAQSAKAQPGKQKRGQADDGKPARGGKHAGKQGTGQSAGQGKEAKGKPGSKGKPGGQKRRSSDPVEEIIREGKRRNARRRR